MVLFDAFEIDCEYIYLIYMSHSSGSELSQLRDAVSAPWALVINAQTLLDLETL